MFEIDQKREMDIMAHRKGLQEVQNGVVRNGSANTAANSVPLEVILYVLVAFTIILVASLSIVYGILFYLGDA